MRKNSGGSWCQCACRGVPGCSTGASVKAAASNWETGECGSHRSLTMASSLSSPPPAPQTSPSQYLLVFLGFSLSSLYSALLQLVSVSCACFSCSGFIFFHLVHPDPTSYPVMTVQSLCTTEKSLVITMLRLLFTISPKDLLDMWEGTDDSSDSMVKKETFFNSGI